MIENSSRKGRNKFDRNYSHTENKENGSIQEHTKQNTANKRDLEMKISHHFQNEKQKTLSYHKRRQK